MISRASIAFGLLPGKLREWSTWLGVSVQSVQAYRYGDRTPNSATRMRIAEEAQRRYNVAIPEEDWDARVNGDEADELRRASLPQRPPPRDPTQPPPPATPDDTAAVTSDLLQHIRDLSLELKDPASTAGYDLQQRIAMGDKLAGMIDRLGKLTGVRLTERQILASPIFHELIERVAEALAPWPDALRAMSEALKPTEKDPRA